MTLDQDERAEVEQLVRALEERGARIENVDVEKWHPDGSVEFRIDGTLW